MNYVENLTNNLYRIIGSGKMYGLKYNSFQSVYYLLQQLKKAPKTFTFDINAYRELSSPELSAFIGYHRYITGYIHVDVYNDYEVRVSHSSVPFSDDFWNTMKEIANIDCIGAAYLHFYMLNVATDIKDCWQFYSESNRDFSKAKEGLTRLGLVPAGVI